MTQEEAICLLCRYRIGRRVKTYYQVRDYNFKESSYARTLVNVLIDNIKHDNQPPIDIVRRFCRMFDDVLGDSDDDHFITHQFARTMEFIAMDILRSFVDRERSDNHAKN